MLEATTLLEDDFREPFERWKTTQNQRHASELLTAVDPVLQSALRSYVGSTPSPTLRSRAKIIAMKAMKTYDPAKAKLRTHLMTQLQGLRRANVREQQIISVPERVALDRHRLTQAETELRDRYGRDPSDGELSDFTGLSAKRLAHIRKARPGMSAGSLVQGGPEEMQNFNPAIMSDDDRQWLNFVYQDLSPTDQLILEHSIGMNGKTKLPKQMIAAKLGVSPGAISQRAARIQAKLNMRESLGINFF